MNPCRFASQALLEHACTVLAADIQATGEAVLEVGAPNGWGPTALTEAQLQVALERAKAAADERGADVTQLRQRSVEVLVPGDAPTSQVRERAPPWA